MTLQLGDAAPDFTADTTVGRIQFHAWLGDSWAVLFSHPRDFTPVGATELAQVARLQRQFDERNVKPIGLSIDTVYSHHQWIEDIRETQGALVHFPIVSDLDRSVARLYGMVHPQHDAPFMVRTLFIIDPKKEVRLVIAYPQTCGLNFDEVLRAIDSLQLTDDHAVCTPAHWRVGDDVIIPPGLVDADARAEFPQGWRELTPYLRLTSCPRTPPAPRRRFAFARLFRWRVDPIAVPVRTVRQNFA
jgi:alkyl hydroperoxide reductase subunit AhpC